MNCKCLKKEGRVEEETVLSGRDVTVEGFVSVRPRMAVWRRVPPVRRL